MPVSAVDTGILIAHVLFDSVVVVCVVTVPFGRVARSLTLAPLTAGDTVPLTSALSCCGTFTSAGQVIVRFGTGAATGKVLGMKPSRSRATDRLAESVRLLGVISATPPADVARPTTSLPWRSVA